MSFSPNLDPWTTSTGRADRSPQALESASRERREKKSQAAGTLASTCKNACKMNFQASKTPSFRHPAIKSGYPFLDPYAGAWLSRSLHCLRTPTLSPVGRGQFLDCKGPMGRRPLGEETTPGAVGEYECDCCVDTNSTVMGASNRLDRVWKCPGRAREEPCAWGRGSLFGTVVRWHQTVRQKPMH